MQLMNIGATMVGIYVMDILSCVFFDVLHEVVFVGLVCIIYGKYYMGEKR